MNLVFRMFFMVILGFGYVNNGTAMEEESADKNPLPEKAIMLEKFTVNKGNLNLKLSLEYADKKINSWHLYNRGFIDEMRFPKHLMVCSSPEQREVLELNIAGFHFLEQSTNFLLKCSFVNGRDFYEYEFNFPLKTYFPYISQQDKSLELTLVKKSEDNTLTLCPSGFIKNTPETSHLFLTASAVEKKVFHK